VAVVVATLPGAFGAAERVAVTAVG
jgi:hypothetical protein